MDNPLLMDLFPAGDVIPPPSKSFGHRALICAALSAAGDANGKSVILNTGLSEDIEATLNAFPLFGAAAERQADVMYVGPAGTSATPSVIDCGESGSTLRFLLPLAAMITKETVRFTGRGRLLDRPLTAYADIFQTSGVQFRQSSSEVSVKGPLAAGHYFLPGNVSSQFVSGLLLALPLADGDSTLQMTSPLESAPYVEMTLEVMRAFGVKVERPSAGIFSIPGKQRYLPASYRLEADYSQAAFFLAAASLGRPVRCCGLNPESVQGDMAIVSILGQMGADINWADDAVAVKIKGRLKAVTVDVREIPDLVPVLASLCALASGTSRIINAERLRLKESDRLKSMATELRKLGADVTEENDSLIITGSASLEGAVTVDSHNDHRVAMALAVVSIGCRGPVKISDPDCVNKSYPAFWDDFRRV